MLERGGEGGFFCIPFFVCLICIYREIGNSQINIKGRSDVKFNINNFFIKSGFLFNKNNSITADAIAINILIPIRIDLSLFTISLINPVTCLNSVIHIKHELNQFSAYRCRTLHDFLRYITYNFQRCYALRATSYALRCGATFQLSYYVYHCKI